MIQESGARLAQVCGGAERPGEEGLGGSQMGINVPGVPGRAACSPRTWASTWLEWRTCCSYTSWWKQTSPRRLRGCELSVPLPCASVTQERVRTGGGTGNARGWEGEHYELKHEEQDWEHLGTRRNDGWAVGDRTREGGLGSRVRVGDQRWLDTRRARLQL